MKWYKTPSAKPISHVGMPKKELLVIMNIFFVVTSVPQNLKQKISNREGSRSQGFKDPSENNS
jgi:hypothetical protein